MNGLVHFEILALEKPVQNEISVVRRQFCLCFDLGAKNSELLRVLILNSELVAVHVDNHGIPPPLAPWAEYL